MVDPIAILRNLVLTNQYYCDTGIRDNHMFVRLDGYLAPKQYADLLDIIGNIGGGAIPAVHANDTDGSA